MTTRAGARRDGPTERAGAGDGHVQRVVDGDDPAYSRVGIGVAFGANGRVWVVVDFGG